MATQENKDFMAEVSTTTENILASKHIVLEHQAAERVIETTAEVFIEQLIAGVAKLAEENGGNASISFKQLFDININNRTSDEGDKDGNVAISFVPGPQAKLLAKKDTISEGDED